MSKGDDGKEDNPGGDMPGGQSWELAKLVGRYETFSKGIERRLGKIEGHLEKTAEAFSDINSTMAAKTEQVDNLEDRIDKVEERDIDLSKRRRLQIDGTTLAAVILTLKELVHVIIAKLN